jgi:hypothetical protein
MDHEFHAERPEQRDVFLTEREVYDEETSYLLRTSIILLLRGALTLELERDIATKLAEVHGQPDERFLVRPTTITPFLLVCPEDILRDMVVRRGYTPYQNLVLSLGSRSGDHGLV